MLPFLLALIGRTLLLAVVPPPQPYVHDEFSYLLAADTFASFRLTNPPHALWQHFETIHELMQPTYMSKYPPAQGFILAFGQVVFGLPWIGVLLSMAIFCGLLPWAFRAWIPATWALIGALLATCKIGVLSYWTDTFWGGGAAAIGGVLMLGSVMRLSRAPTAGMAAVFVLGGAILANSRPDGCAVMALIFGGFLLWRWFGGGRWRTTWPSYPLRVLPAACLVGVPILLFMGYYNYRITGSALELPYRAFEKQYAIWTPFIWQQKPSPEPVYRHDFLRRFWVGWEGDEKTFDRQHWLKSRSNYFRLCVHFYFGRAFYPGLGLIVPALLFGRKGRTVFGLLFLTCAATCIISEVLPHYIAPAAALIFLAATVALRAGWYFAPRGFPWGKLAVLMLVALFLVLTAWLLTSPNNRFLAPIPGYVAKRQGVLAALDRQPGRLLVFVRHGPGRSVHDVWVFNRADIDASRIVWVDAMTPAEDQEILDYYAPQKRTVWLLDDDAEVTLKPYGDPAAPPIFEMKNPPLDPSIEN